MRGVCLAVLVMLAGCAPMNGRRADLRQETQRGRAEMRAAAPRTSVEKARSGERPVEAPRDLPPEAPPVSTPSSP
jgi:hypothetical protein